MLFIFLVGVLIAIVVVISKASKPASRRQNVPLPSKLNVRSATAVQPSPYRPTSSPSTYDKSPRAMIDENSLPSDFKAILDAAFIDSELDGEWLVTTQYPKTTIGIDGGAFLMLCSIFGVNDGLPRETLLELANTVADSLPIPRVFVSPDAKSIIFSMAVPIADGITARNFVECVRKFAEGIEDMRPVFQGVLI